MRKFLSLFLIFVLGWTVFNIEAQAKLLPQAGKISPKQSTAKIAGSTIGVYPQLRRDRRALIINFTNLQNAQLVSYSLVYDTSVQQEGAGGALNLNGQITDKVELLFGTCSAGVCRYHTGIKNARVEVSYTLKNGKKYLKKFKIKI